MNIDICRYMHLNADICVDTQICISAGLVPPLDALPENYRVFAGLGVTVTPQFYSYVQPHFLHVPSSH